MIYMDGKEAYGWFLSSSFWIGLSRKKRLMVGNRCERCGSTDRIASHHRFYRDHWFDVELGDLEVLCKTCHAREHGIAVEPVVRVSRTNGSLLTKGQKKFLRMLRFRGRNVKNLEREWKAKARLKRNVSGRRDRYGNFILNSGSMIYDPK